MIPVSRRDFVTGESMLQAVNSVGGRSTISRDQVERRAEVPMEEVDHIRGKLLLQNINGFTNEKALELKSFLQESGGMDGYLSYSLRLMWIGGNRTSLLRL